MTRNSFSLLLLILACSLGANAQYWQQRVDYTMNIDFDAEKHQYAGTQKLVYTNNSPDTLHKVYYHLYFNAFQPGSMMDARSRTIDDPDPRVMYRIGDLKEDEIGYQKITSLKQDGKTLKYEMVGTILEVTLNKALLPGKKTTFDMVFNSQVPTQIRRTGRNNSEGIDYSMTQWYPKLSEYDVDGWHANPYVGREFHGVWGSFDVTINIDKKYVIGGTGYLQNPQEIGYGYEDKSKPVKRPSGDKLAWHFVAPMVHDFAWAADPDFTHDIAKVPDGPDLHFFYQADTLADNWKRLQPMAVKSFEIMNKDFGKYPYEQYSIIQGGDGGMEYPMATLITAHGSFTGLVSVTVHESIHSWFQGLLATNESKFPWMDEGFTTYAQYYVMDKLFNQNKANPHGRSYGSYLALARSEDQEPLTTHADHYHKNRTYGISSYSKGAVCVSQLNYVMGSKAFWKGMKRYFNEWKYKHPTSDDFKRVMEKSSGLELDWYFENFVGTTNTVDYGIKDVESAGSGTQIDLERIGKFPMPLDVVITLTDGREQTHTIPLRVMRGQKGQDKHIGNVTTEADWPWVYPTYRLVVDVPMDQIERIEIDPSKRLADVDRSNNFYPSGADVIFESN